MIKVTYYYSACVGLRTPETSILCDPWFTDGVYDGSWYQYPKLAAPLEAIGPYDYVYISHIHPDHYDAKFLRQYQARYREAKIIIAPFKVNHLSKKMKVDGLSHEICDEMKVGATRFKILPNELNPYDVDSALAVVRGDQSVVNMNDNALNTEHSRRILDYIGGSPTITLQGYTGAGPYPQTYYRDVETLKEKSEAKKREFFERYKKMRDSFDPKVTIPFAGKYILGGKLVHLNAYRGIADAVEVKAFDSRAVVLADGGLASIDTESLKPTAERAVCYDVADVEAYARTLLNNPMHYEKYFSGIPSEALPIRRLLPKAYENALKHSVCREDFYYCIKLDWGWFVANARKGSNEARFTDRVDEVSPRAEIEIDGRYLFGLLTCVFHWNNAEVGSQYMTTRIPDRYNRDASAFLNFFHV